MVRTPHVASGLRSFLLRNSHGVYSIRSNLQSVRKGRPDKTAPPHGELNTDIMTPEQAISGPITDNGDADLMVPFERAQGGKGAGRRTLWGWLLFLIGEATKLESCHAGVRIQRQ